MTKNKLAYYYHLAWLFSSLIAGVVVVFIGALNGTESVAGAIVMTITIVVVLTIGFLIFPICCIVCATFIKYLPTFAFPIYIILCIGNLFGDHHDIGFDILLKSVGLSAFGLFNIYTRMIVSYEDSKNEFLY